MDAFESAINDYLDLLNLQITDPSYKQQQFFENIKLNINQHERRSLSDTSENGLLSPCSLRDIQSPCAQVRCSKSDEAIKIKNKCRHLLNIQPLQLTPLNCRKQDV